MSRYRWLGIAAVLAIAVASLAASAVAGGSAAAGKGENDAKSEKHNLMPPQAKKQYGLLQKALQAKIGSLQPI